jgi:hypothetical protein
VNKFDPQNWRKHYPVAINSGKDQQLMGIESQLLLVRWTRAKNTPAMVGTLKGMILSPFGTPATPTQQFKISDIQDYYEFWQLPTDGLKYNLIAHLEKTARHASQLTIWEFIPLIGAGQSGSNNNNSTQFSNNQGINIVSFTAPSTPASTSNTGSVTSVTAATGSFLGAASNAGRLDGFGVNNSNKTVWVLFSATPAATAKPATQVPVGGNFDIPTGYVGAIQLAIASGGAAPTGTIDITEFIAQ